jgi:hypothetical protein
MTYSALVCGFNTPEVGEKMCYEVLRRSFPFVVKHPVRPASHKAGVSTILTTTASGSPDDPNDTLGNFGRRHFPNGTLHNIGPFEIEGFQYRCLVHNTGTPNEYYRSDHWDWPLSTSLEQCDFRPTELGLESRVDDVFGCVRHRRCGTVLAASTGLIPDPARSGFGKDRNEGGLPAVKNDFNQMLAVLQGLDPELKLTGVTAAGIIGKRDFLLELIWLALTDSSSINAYSESPSGFQGTILYETKIHGVLVKGGYFAGGGIEIVRGGAEEIAISSESVMLNPVIEINQHPCEPEPLAIAPPVHSQKDSCESYGLLYYAGHGADSGNLVLASGEIVTPEELLLLSKESGRPLLIILDMCHAGEFGRRYQEQLESIGGRGVVLCAAAGDQLAYECPGAGQVRRPMLTCGVAAQDLHDGRGIFTTALTLAFLKLRDTEAVHGQRPRVSLRRFILDAVRPLCWSIADEFGLKRQDVAIYGA